MMLRGAIGSQSLLITQSDLTDCEAQRVAFCLTALQTHVVPAVHLTGCDPRESKGIAFVCDRFDFHAISLSWRLWPLLGGECYIKY